MLGDSNNDKKLNQVFVAQIITSPIKLVESIEINELIKMIDSFEELESTESIEPMIIRH